jgi:hypothetical protein
VEGFCVKCRAKVTIRNPERVTLKDGRRAIRGQCPLCGATTFKVLIAVEATSASETGNTTHTSILVVFANPKGSDPLRLAAEDRVLHECVRLSRYRESLTVATRHAATIHDVRRALLEEDRRIVHFSGHGTGKGLAFENEMGEVQLVPQDALAELLSAYSPPLECVVLNACYSAVQASLVSLGVPYTIGMDGAISDEGGIEFTRGFYDAVGAGKTIEFAYAEGCRTIKLMGLPDGSTPVLLKKGD